MPPAQSRSSRRGARTTEYLYDPSQVAALLAGLENLRAQLSDPYTETQSAAFPELRKSARQIYRILGNAHYPHLVELLQQIDSCLVAGFHKPDILRTRATKPFGEGLAEIEVADHLRRSGFTIAGLDVGKGNQPVPDVLAELDGLVLAVEVFAPTQWPGITAYTELLTHRLKNLDIPFEFALNVQHAQIDEFAGGPNLRALMLHPCDLSDALDVETRRFDAVQHLVAETEAGLLGQGSQRVAGYAFSDINLKTTVDVEHASKSSQRYAREIVTGGPPTGGDRPESVFDGVIDRVISKLKKRQAVNAVPGAVPILVVDLSRTKLLTELSDPPGSYYATKFEATVSAKLTTLHGYGAVVLCLASEAARPLATRFRICDSDLIDQATLAAAFPVVAAG